ncbi:hypothetical protein HYFRA_00002538 [Hymenoscyphus fraxineus]|uniref:AB hydrolase-1 domain-containing protein n=1 Tax=Hymenoscyphus fraxineus TaxID=746836 RepID=A0A9N9PZF8_9HELO|nr:hypothetical protein HYFRA_00002538 [Hymenoscyphus fraxineus]
MDSYPQHQFTTKRSFTYNYYITPPQPGKEWVLLLHGFLSAPFHFRHQMKYLSEKGYGILTPDLLGYGESSQPADVKAYTGTGMTEDLIEILDHEKIEHVLGVGHDWGSFLQSRLANYYPSRIKKCVFLDVGYLPPGSAMTRETAKILNTMTKKQVGYCCFGYPLFFDEDGATKLMEDNIDSVIPLFFTRDEEIVKEYIGAEGGTRKWLEGKMTTELPSFFTPEDQEHFRKYFSTGFSGPVNWWRAQIHDINHEDEKDLSKELEQPVLIVCARNVISMAADFAGHMDKYCDDMEVKKTTAGHWIMLENIDETNETLERFFEK